MSNFQLSNNKIILVTNVFDTQILPIYVNWQNYTVVPTYLFHEMQWSKLHADLYLYRMYEPLLFEK